MGLTLWVSPLQNVDEIVSKVQSNVQSMRLLKVNLDCRERRTFFSLRSTPPSMNWSTETDIVRAANGQPHRVLMSAEGRTPESVLNSPSPYGNEEFFGTAESVFYPYTTSFGPFKLAGSENINGRPMFVLEFSGKPPNFTSGYGKAWIDQESFQVTRIERHLFNQTFDPFTTEEWGAVRVGGKDVWLPTKRTIQTVSRGTSTPNGLEVFERISCRRFEVSSTVRPAQ
jgi:hypothetical protein